MKKLGLVGGMGPQSTIPYYHDIVYGVQERTARDFFPNLTIESVNCFDVLKMCADERYDDITAYLLRAIENLHRAGAEFAALTANTAHIVFDDLARRSPIPLVSIIESTCAEASRRGYRRVGLLGTIFTMTRDFYKKPFFRDGIGVVIPRGDDLQLVDNRITSELEYGIVKLSTLAEFQRIIDDMKAQDGIEAVILGCTELPLILSDEVSPLPVLDTVKIHTADLISKILE